MFDVDEDNMSVRVRMSADISLVDRVVGRCARYLRGLGFSRSHDITLVTRELLNNAIIHGSRGISKATVEFQLWHEDRDVFRISVADQGPGFDYQALDMRLPADPRRVTRRGYALINAIVNRLEFDGNGNHVTAWVKL